MVVFSIQQVLDKVNAYRHKHTSPAVVWDIVIQNNAQHWADHLAKNNDFQHSQGKYGENLAMEFDGKNPDKTKEVLDAIDRWYNEVSNYNFDKPSFSMGTGHFTQLVWKATRSIGVGVAITKNHSVIVVMQFDPPGNMNAPSFFRQNVHKA